MPVIYLHAGTMKTGTTALQRFATENSGRFEDVGCYYPITGRKHHLHHHGIALYWSKNEALRKKYDVHPGVLEELSGELKRHRDKNILLSSECLLGDYINWEEFLSLLPHKNIKVIVYFRRQDAFLASLYAQFVAGNHVVQPPEVWLEESMHPDKYPNQYLRVSERFNYLGIVERLSGMFGKENIIVRVYEPQQFFGGNIFLDFCHALSVSVNNNWCFPANNINPRLSISSLKFNSLLNTVIDASTPYSSRDVLAQFSWQEGSVAKNPLEKKYSLFSPQTCHEILDICEQTNRKIARDYLGRKDERLFYEPWPDLTQDWQAIPALSPQKTEEIVDFIIAKQPELAMTLYEKLRDAVTSPHTAYLQEAKETILPVLAKKLNVS